MPVNAGRPLPPAGVVEGEARRMVTSKSAGNMNIYLIYIVYF